MKVNPVVVVADDDAVVRAYVSRLLMLEGYEVIQARDGREAVDQLRAQPCDALVIDLAMPESEGIETIARVRRELPRLRIVVMSGAYGPDMIHMAVVLGADVGFQKPFTAAQMLKALSGCSDGDRRACHPLSRHCGAIDCRLHRQTIRNRAIAPSSGEALAGLETHPRLRAYTHAP